LLKTCKRCQQEQEIENFDWNRSGLTRKANCHNCVTVDNRERMAKHRAKTRGPEWQSKIVKMEACSVMGHACRTCKERKSCDAYYLNNTFANGHEGECKSCKDLRRRKRFQKHREDLDSGLAENRFRQDQATALKRKFNITSEQYEFLLAQQNNVCALCEQPETRISGHTGRVMNLAVDHDRRCCPDIRSCGKCVRGLLCTDCNTSLGKIEYKPKLIEKFNLNQYINNRPLENYINDYTIN
jgi:hypothetical protein